MNTIRVRYCAYLITPVSQEIIDTANLLNIDTKAIYLKSDYLYLDFKDINSFQVVLRSQHGRHEGDIITPSKVFTEILIDVAAGIQINDAMYKHNIVVTY